MNRRFWGPLALGLLGGLSLRAAEQPERVLTLDQSVFTALQNNSALLSAQGEARIAKQRVAEARSLLWPSMGLHMSASRYFSDTPAVLPPEAGGTWIPTSRNGEPDNIYAGRLTLRQLLFNGGRTRANIRLAEAALEQARIRVEQVRRRVTLEVTQAFYDELLAKQQIALTGAAAQDLQVLAASLPAGDSAARVLLDGVRSRLRRAQAERRFQEERASLGYLSALGLELYTRVELKGTLASAPFAADLPKLLARAQEARLEIRGKDYQREMDRLSVNLSEAERFPVVALVAGYEMNDQRFPLENNYWNTTLSVSLPLFDGFASRARIRQTRMAIHQSRIERAALEDQIAREVRQAHADVVYWQEEMGARRGDWDQLEKAYRRLPMGKDSAEKAQVRLEVLGAAEAYWDAVRGHLVARAQLENAVGRPLDP